MKRCLPDLRARAFTLVELMVSTAIISLILLILVSITGQTSATWRYTTGKAEQFREARTAFDTMTTRLSQATLNTYLDYFDASGNPRSTNQAFSPAKYGRQSELLFTSGPASKLLGDSGSGARITHCVFFHAPLGLTEDDKNATSDTYRGLDNLLNVWGYCLELRDDKDLRPSFITDSIAPPRWRFRLMEFMQPSQKLSTYLPSWSGKNGTRSVSAAQQHNWFKTAANTTPAPMHVLAENIVALVIRPRLSLQDIEQLTKAGKTNTELTKDYVYDTRYDPAASRGRYPDPMLNPVNQLPPILQVTMVAIDELSASRLGLDRDSKNIFKVEGKFADPLKYESDLLRENGSGGSLEDELIAQRVSYRIFTTNVPIRGAKWSREQTN